MTNSKADVITSKENLVAELEAAAGVWLLNKNNYTLESLRDARRAVLKHMQPTGLETPAPSSNELAKADAYCWMGQWRGSASTGNYVAAPGNWYRAEDYTKLWDAYEEMKRCYEAWISEAHKRGERIAALERAAPAHETLPPRITVMDDGRAMGGSDVCHTCAAHCTVINDLETALRGLYWDNVDYLTLNKLGGMQNHWMRAARMALGMDVDDVRPSLKAKVMHKCKGCGAEGEPGSPDFCSADCFENYSNTLGKEVGQ